MKTMRITVEGLKRMFINANIEGALLEAIPVALEKYIPLQPQENQLALHTELAEMRKNPQLLYDELYEAKQAYAEEEKMDHTEVPVDYENESFRSFSLMYERLQEHFYQHQDEIVNMLKEIYLEEGIKLVVV